MSEATLHDISHDQNSTPLPTDSNPHPAPATAPFEIPPVTWKERLASFFVMVFVLLFLVAGLAISGVIPHSWFIDEREQGTTTLPDGQPVRLVEGRPRTLVVPKEVREALGMRKAGKELVAVVEPPKKGMPLLLVGSTMLDPTRVLRIRAGFAPAKVVSVGRTRDLNNREGGASQFRELRAGDTVKKGTVLAEFESIDVGSKKNDLYDALVKLKFDEEILERADTPEARGAISEVFRLSFQAAVMGDNNAKRRAENTLRTWNIPPEDIEAIYKEAEQAGLDVVKVRKKSEDKEKEKEQREEEKKAKEEQLKRWARVELKAPYDATLIERNVSQYETVNDNTTNLFFLLRADQIAVVANAPEDELPTLQNLKFSQRHWTVRTTGLPDAGVVGPIDEIGYIIDINQHTAMIKGHIPNPNGRLRGGLLATFTIELPPPPDTVEVPIDAIVDDGRQCVVFVQPDPAKDDYTMRRVLLTQRFEKTAFVRSKLKPEDRILKPGEQELGVLVPEPLRPGETVILSGVLELKKELEDKESESAKK